MLETEVFDVIDVTSSEGLPAGTYPSLRCACGHVTEWAKERAIVHLPSNGNARVSPSHAVTIRLAKGQPPVWTVSVEGRAAFEIRRRIAPTSPPTESEEQIADGVLAVYSVVSVDQRGWEVEWGVNFLSLNQALDKIQERIFTSGTSVALVGPTLHQRREDSWSVKVGQTTTHRIVKRLLGVKRMSGPKTELVYRSYEVFEFRNGRVYMWMGTFPSFEVACERITSWLKRRIVAVSTITIRKSEESYFAWNVTRDGVLVYRVYCLYGWTTQTRIRHHSTQE